MTLSVVYYPYSRSLVSSTLKKAALLFDTLYLLDSEPWFVRTAINRTEQRGVSVGADIDQLESDYHLLRSEGFIRIFDAASIVREHDQLLTANVMSDISDDSFCRTAIANSVETWNILRDRIPPTLLEALSPGAGSFGEAISLQALINANNELDSIVDEHVRGFARWRWGGYAEGSYPAIETFLKSHYRYVIGGNPHIELPSYEFPFLQASSLRINECLVAAALNDCIPYTDSTIHDSLLRLKVDHALEAIDTQPDLRRKLSIDLPIKFPRQSLAVQILDRLIPDDALRRRSVAELLTYRARNEKLLTRFHSYLEMLSVEVGDVAPGYEYDRRVQKVISSKVLPDLGRARDDLLASYEDAFGGIAISSGVGVFS
ncbi:MAG: hypothetical protein WCF17_18500, partial [Terracidiphilus sp.]